MDRSLLARGTIGLAIRSMFVFLVAFTVEAQLPLDPSAPVGIVNGPNSLLLADLDRDGDLDALATSGPDGTEGEVVWWAFDGAGGWGPKNTIDASFLLGKDAVAVDLDRDGDLDVAAVSFQSDEVAWWENTSGDASTWSGKKVIASGADGAVALAVGDLDLDGDPDLVACLRDADQLRWFENDGTPSDGGWVAHDVNAAVFSEATGVVVGDVDRDGDLDVVGASRLGDEVAWWENDGTPADDLGGDGNSWTFHSISASLNGPRDVALEDLDRDGDLDVAVVAVQGDRLTWLENLTGDGTSWSTPVLIAVIDGARDLLARDLDFDGDVDLLSAAQDGNRVAWWENATGDADSWTEHEIESSLSGARGVAVADVDRDGDLDLAATGHLADTVQWWENIPIHRSVDFVADLVANDFADIATAADLDRDGDLDVVGGGFPTWYERQGSLWQPHAVDGLAGVTGGLLTSVAVADLDHDGDPDIAGTNFFRVFWWENDGTPLDDTGGGLGTSWTRHQVSENHSLAQGLSIVDINRDGDLDLLAFDLSNDQVLWWQSDGSPGDDMGGDGNSWTERVIDDLTHFPRAAMPRDVDRDGDLDVLVISQTHSPDGERISWWSNANGLGTSWTRNSIGTGNPISTVVDDVDADGDLDVITGHSNGISTGQLDLLEQQAPGDGSAWTVSFGMGLLPPAELSVNELVAGDLDLDGDLDVAAVGDRDNTYWFENPDAASGWIRSPVAMGQFETDGLIALEADGRGAPDLIAASSDASKIVIWENRAAQAILIASDVSVSPLEDDVEVAVLRVNAISLGRSGDHHAEIAHLTVLLEESPGTPLTETQVNAILAGLSLYEDIDASGDFDAAADILIGSMSSFSPVDGVVSLVLPDFAATISSSGFRNYFLVVETTVDASVQAVSRLRLTLLTSLSRMEDVVYDSPLALQSPEDTSTKALEVNNALFRDGFETGDTTAWAN